MIEKLDLRENGKRKHLRKELTSKRLHDNGYMYIYKRKVKDILRMANVGREACYRRKSSV